MYTTKIDLDLYKETNTLNIKCLGNNQHMNNIWSSVHEKVK